MDSPWFIFFLTLYGMLLPFGNILKDGLKLSEYLILDIVDIFFVNIASEIGRHHWYSLLSDSSKL